MILRRRKGTLAIDLGSSQVKMVSVEDAGASRPRISALGIESLPADAIVAGEIMDYRLVVETVRSLADRLGVKGNSAATSVSGRDVIVKRIKMDRMREQEARQVIRWEAEQHVPFDMESVSLDFEILDPEAEGLQMEVLLVAAKMDLVESRMRLLKEAGFETTVIDLDAFAVQTAFERNYDHAGYGTFCLVNVGRETTNLNLIENGRPILTRDITIGERKIAEAIVQELGIPTEQAEERLREADLDVGTRRVVEQAIEGIVTPIERARAFLASGDRPRAQIDEVVLSGGGAGIPRLAATIAERLQTQVTELDPLRSVELDPVHQPVVLKGGGPTALSVAVGLGLRGRE